MRSLGGGADPVRWMSSYKEEIGRHRETLGAHVHRGTMTRRRRERTATCTPRREVLVETDPADTRALALQNHGKSNFCFKASLWCLVRGALEVRPT